jgi:cytoskeleton protein RodZ
MQSESSLMLAEEGALSSAGAQLRHAREMRGETINEVSLALKLAPRQVEALEIGRYDALPGLAFIRGFMRNYARYLGLDPAPLLADVEAVLGRTDVDLSPVCNAAGDLPNGSGRRASAAPVGTIAGVLLAIMLGGWYFDWFDTEPARPVTEDIALPSAEPASAESPSNVAPSLVAPIAPDVSMPAPATGGGQAAQPGVATLAAGAPTAPPTAPATSGSAVGQVVADTEAAPAVEGDRLAFRFAGPSWVEVRDAAGTIVYSGTNAAGNTRSVQGKPPFSLVIGNAAQVSLERGGQPVDLAPHIKGTVARLKLQ